MVKRPSNVGRIDVVVDGAATEQLQPLESLEAAAIETFAIQKPIIYLKTVLRAVTKGLAAEQTKQEMTENMDDTFAFFTRIAADLMIDQTENADLRVSRFFPAEAAVRELHLKEGTYTIKINYYSRGGRLLHTDERTGVRLEAGRLNVIESAYLN